MEFAVSRISLPPSTIATGDLAGMISPVRLITFYLR
jgi:hypothetical protein